MKETYQDYFKIDPKYYAAVTAQLIQEGKVKWELFYPHATFVNLLEKTHVMLSGNDSRSLWVEGAYGTGKSHAALTVKSLLEASDDEIRKYFTDYGLNQDLCQSLITDKNAGHLITIHRIGSSSIHSDQQLILALQESITAALQEHGIQNRGEASLRDAAIKWFEEREANKQYFNNLIQESYTWEFGGRSIDEVLDDLKHGDESTVTETMRNIMKVAEDNNLMALRMDPAAMCEWIKSIIEQNQISILFVWDEFTEFFQNNQNSLTGFQQLVEVSESHPFYFMIVTHESSALIANADMRKKILNRFVGDKAVRIEMPENMAFQLMKQAMKETDDPVKLAEWSEIKADLNGELAGVRQTIIDSARRNTTLGKKTVLTDGELSGVFPIHPYAALLLKHMSVAFNSNARSMFDFIISNDMTDAKGFKWFIHTHGPDEEENILTIDMLWDFFTGKDQDGLNDDVRGILDSYSRLAPNALNPEQIRVFKTIILLEAISVRVKDVELLRPNEQNIDLAFCGTDWPKGKARSIAAGLCERGFLFERPSGNGPREYTVAGSGGDHSKIVQLKEEVKRQTNTQDLIDKAELVTADLFPAAIRQRYYFDSASVRNFSMKLTKLKHQQKENHFGLLFGFALDSKEEENLSESIRKAVCQCDRNLLLIQCTTSMGTDLYAQYVENMAFSKNYMQSEKQQARGYENQAKKVLQDWKQNLYNGAFLLYSSEMPSGKRLANLDALMEELRNIIGSKYYYALERYHLTDQMFLGGAFKQGAKCGLTENLEGRFVTKNASTSIDQTVMEQIWNVPNYWVNPSAKGRAVVQMKLKVDSLIQSEFQSPAGRISILKIYETLENEPFGLLPNNISALVLGFLLKEYANSDYFWSNGSSSEAMTVDKMSVMIDNVLKHTANPGAKYRDEFIVSMSIKQRLFLKCTAEVFQINEKDCGSIESARDQVRIQMKNLPFPIWCVKYAIPEVELSSNPEDLMKLVDGYTGLVNTANGTAQSESDTADLIGSIVQEKPELVNDLKVLLTSEYCRKGMIAYIGQYKNGLLKELAEKIGDNGAYIDQVKKRFSADAANWVWNIETANEKIMDIILEYQIIYACNQAFHQKNVRLADVEREWIKRTNNIKIPYGELKRNAVNCRHLLEELYHLSTSGHISEQSRSAFYQAVTDEYEAFNEFYRNQLQYFKLSTEGFLEDLSDEDIQQFYYDLPAGQFLKNTQEYFQIIQKRVEEYRQSLKKERLKTLWKEKTGTKDPQDWSDRYETPILCMFDDTERSYARQVFDTIRGMNRTDANVLNAIEYLEKADFYQRLYDPEERNRCFMKRIVNNYAILLKDADVIRRELINSVPDSAYFWMDNSTVQNKLESMAKRQYKLNGQERAQAVIDKMDAEQLRKYLNEQINDNLKFGMEILKNE